jgi:hypothetical protein
VAGDPASPPVISLQMIAWLGFVSLGQSAIMSAFSPTRSLTTCADKPAAISTAWSPGPSNDSVATSSSSGWPKPNSAWLWAWTWW